MKTVLAVVAAFLCFAAIAADPVPEELKAYEAQYAQLHAQLTKARDEAIAKAVATYKSEITTLVANAQQQGDLDYVLAIKNELKRLEGDPSAPKEPAPKRMTQLRRTQWGARQAEDKALEQFKTGAENLLRSYTVTLGNLEKKLVAADRIAEAKLVREKREALADGTGSARIRITSSARPYQLSEIRHGSITKLDHTGNLVIHQFPDAFAGWGVTTCNGGKGISYTFHVSTPGRVYIAANSEVGGLVPKLGWDKGKQTFRLGTGKPVLTYLVFSKKFGIGEGKTPEILHGEAYPLLLVPPANADQKAGMGPTARLHLTGGSEKTGPLENKKTARSDRGGVRLGEVSPRFAGWRVALHSDHASPQKVEAMSPGWVYVAYSAIDYNESQWPGWTIFGQPFWLLYRYNTPFVILRKQVTKGPVPLPSPRQWWPLVLLPPGPSQ